jgi:GxxExxY protein
MMMPDRELALIHADLSRKIIGCALAVHRALGPGFVESVYENALAIEMEKQDLAFARQVEVKVIYAGQQVGLHRLDMLLENKIIVELKAKEQISDSDKATTLSYLRATQKDLALILNFGTPRLVIKRLANTKSDS